jgi:pyruvate/2-oxoglutarate dehydrogenase complex dihydrolipoamide acyltransferase (E2) component
MFIQSGWYGHDAENHGVSISVNDFIIRATALALKEVPEANGKLDVHTTPLLRNLISGIMQIG